MRRAPVPGRSPEELRREMAKLPPRRRDDPRLDPGDRSLRRGEVQGELQAQLLLRRVEEQGRHQPGRCRLHSNLFIGGSGPLPERGDSHRRRPRPDLTSRQARPHEPGDQRRHRQTGGRGGGNRRRPDQPQHAPNPR